MLKFCPTANYGKNSERGRDRQIEEERTTITPSTMFVEINIGVCRLFKKNRRHKVSAPNRFELTHHYEWPDMLKIQCVYITWRGLEHGQQWVQKHV